MNFNRVFSLLLIIVLVSTTVLAAVEPEEIPLQLDGISEELQPLVDTIQPILARLYVVVGGLFGLYVILILFRVYYERKKVKILKDIRYDLDQQNLHSDINYSKQRKGAVRKIISRFEGNSDPEKKLEKLKRKKKKKRKK